MRESRNDRLKRIGKKHIQLSVLAWVLGFASLFFVAPDLYASDEPTVSATVDRNALNPEDTLTLTISVQTSEQVSIGQPTLPSLQDFEVLNEWTTQSQQASMIATPAGPQFKRVSIASFNYMLMPKKQGDLHIGGVEVVVDGKVYMTKPIRIKVAPGAGVGSQPRGGRGGSGGVIPPDLFEDEDDLFAQLLRRAQPPAGGSRTLPVNPNDAFFIQIDTDKTEAYVGEQVTVSFYLYTRGLIRDLDTLKYPSLKGFWKEDIEIATHLNFQSEVVNGIPYKKALLASYALFPIKEGTATIDSYRVRCSVIAPDSMGGLGFGKAYSYTKASQPVKITVKPVPAEGRPEDFSGAVGEFQLSARVEDRVVTENQPLTLKVRFEGRGNAKLIDMPPITYPEGLELYEQQDEARFFRTGTSFKEFKILLIPRREGEFTIPSISVSVFDPNQKTFVRKTTEPITFTAKKGLGGGVASQSLPEEAARKKPREPEKPRLITELQASRAMSSAIQWPLWAALYSLISTVLVWRARTELGWGQRKKDILRVLTARLKKIETLGHKGDWRGVGTEMTNALYFVLGAVSGERGANAELDKLLQKAPPSVRRELGEQLRKQMEFFQMLTFAPEAVVEGLKKNTDLKKVISEMEELMVKAVSLGLSGEQSNGSEPGPRAS